VHVLVVEDEDAIAAPLAEGLTREGFTVMRVATGQDALDAPVPDVVLLDLRMPRLDGLGVLQRLRERGTSRPTLILTTFDDDTMLFEAVRAGARGWLLKDVSLERLTDAIRTVAAGGTCIEPVITERIMRALERSNVSFESAELPEPLTDREKTILRLLAGGYSNREISQLLAINEGTVKNHISNVLSKLGVRDRTRAVLKAIDHGFI
jgi:DNA-binding NarL/FixJ family response regulator